MISKEMQLYAFDGDGNRVGHEMVTIGDHEISRMDCLVVTEPGNKKVAHPLMTCGMNFFYGNAKFRTTDVLDEVDLFREADEGPSRTLQHLQQCRRVQVEEVPYTGERLVPGRKSLVGLNGMEESAYPLPLDVHHLRRALTQDGCARSSPWCSACQVRFAAHGCASPARRVPQECQRLRQTPAPSGASRPTKTAVIGVDR